MDLYFVQLGGVRQFLQPIAELLVIGLAVWVGSRLRGVE